MTGELLPLLGFGVPVAGDWATPQNMQRIAGRAEELGYASLWTFQRLLYPAGAGLDPAHRSVHDAVVPLAYVAGHTDRIRLGTATICAPFTPPAVLAKTMTSLDVLSGGRLTVGLGMGWLAQEYTAAGVPFERRGARMDEYLRCLRSIWTQVPVEFAGEFYTVPPSHVSPSPVQTPHPPLLFGGSAESALRRAGRLSDGWISASRFEAAKVPGAIAVLKEGAVEAGRDPEALRVVIRAATRVREADEEMQFTGTVDKIRRDIADYGRNGVTELFIDLNFDEQIGSASADAATSMRRAHEALEAFAPDS